MFFQLSAIFLTNAHIFVGFHKKRYIPQDKVGSRSCLDVYVPMYLKIHVGILTYINIISRVIKICAYVYETQIRFLKFITFWKNTTPYLVKICDHFDTLLQWTQSLTGHDESDPESKWDKVRAKMTLLHHCCRCGLHSETGGSVYFFKSVLA